MQTIKAKVQVNLDHTVTVQVPDDMKVPADVQVGEYDAVLVLNSRSDSEVVQELNHAEGEQPDHLMTEAWEKWVEEVEQLPLSTNSIQEGDYQKHLVEKYRKQGLIL
jgi:predicted DNA-binding protein